MFIEAEVKISLSYTNTLAFPNVLLTATKFLSLCRIFANPPTVGLQEDTVRKVVCCCVIETSVKIQLKDMNYALSGILSMDSKSYVNLLFPYENKTNKCV